MKVNLAKLHQATSNKQKIYNIRSKPIPKENKLEETQIDRSKPN